MHWLCVCVADNNDAADACFAAAACRTAGGVAPGQRVASLIAKEGGGVLKGRKVEGKLVLTSGCCGQSSWAKLYEMVVSVKFLREEVMMFCSITEVEVVVVFV